jgi:hypothetical protein
MSDIRDKYTQPSPPWVPLTKRGGDLVAPSKPRPDPEIDDLPANRVAVELQQVNARLEILHAERMKLESRREALELRLLETTDAKLNAERSREWASRVNSKAPPRVTYRCRYCNRHTRSLHGSLPVCEECMYQIKFDAALEDLTDVDNG